MAENGLDLGNLNAKLDWQNQDYWLHIDADTKLDKYPAKQHARAVATKLGVDSGLVFLAGEKTVLLKDSDQPVPFRQRRYFYYLSGCNESDCYVLYDISKDFLTLYIPKVDLRHAVWGGAGSTKAEAYAKYDVDAVEYTSALFSFGSVDGRVERKSLGTLYLTNTHQSPTENVFHQRLFRTILDGKIDTTELKSAIELCRVIKYPHEVQLIRRANEISAKAHRAVLENIRNFQNERQIEGIFLDTCISAGAHNQAYSVIAGAGTNAAVLHYVSNNDSLDGKQLVLLDAGAEVECYASDVTRTFPITGRWSEEAKDIYDAVSEMQKECIARIRPGVHYRDLQILAMAIATRRLLSLGILRNGSLEDILKAGTILAFFPHGLGHHVGLEVHDVLHVPIQSKDACQISPADMNIYRDTELDGMSHAAITELYQVLIDPKVCKVPVTVDSPVLEAGMVITVEPGLYFSDFALSKVYLRDPKHAKFIDNEVLAKYLPVGGVRIEDDILVTKKGYENLTTAPKGDKALKIIRGEADETEPLVSEVSMPPSVAPAPCASRCPTSVDKGKSPMRNLPVDLRKILNETEGTKYWTPQFSEDLSSKCSTDVKQKASDILPPRLEADSLIGAFPFGHQKQLSASNNSDCERLLTEVLKTQEETRSLLGRLDMPQTSTQRNHSLEEMRKALGPHQLDAGSIRITQELQAAQEEASVKIRSVLAYLRNRETLEGDIEHTLQTIPLCPLSQSAQTSSMPPAPAFKEQSSPASLSGRVLYDFDGQGDSDCLQVNEGDLIQIMSRGDNDWCYGKSYRSGQRGWLPSTYITEVADEVPSDTKPEPALPPTASGPSTTERSQDVDGDVAAQIQKDMSQQHLRHVFGRELAVLLKDADKEQDSVATVLQIRKLLEDEHGDLTCFSGLCMHLKALNGGLDFGALPGAGMDKFRNLYKKLDELLRAEFGEFHVFFRMNKEQRDVLERSRWEYTGIKTESETGGEMGICGACRLCRNGFAQWDEKWLADDAEEDEDDE